MEDIAQNRYQDVRLFQEALQALEAKSGIAGRLVGLQQMTVPGHRADAVLEFAVNGHTHRYIAEGKSGVDRKSVVLQAKTALSRFPEPGLLVAPYVSREIADYCRETGLQFIDTHGNAYLNAPGLHVYIKGEKDRARKTLRSVRGTANPTALRIAFVLLCEPVMLQVPFRELMASAGVSLGAISSTLKNLKERGLLLDAERSSQRTLLEPKRLFDEWVTNYPIVLRPKLNAHRYSAPDPGWWKSVQPQTWGAMWGGEVAAERITGYLKPAAQTLYVEPASMPDCLKHLVSTYRLRPDPYGQVEILEKFWSFPPDPANPDIVPAILVYADLMATLDPRNNEVAGMIWERRIATALAQA